MNKDDDSYRSPGELLGDIANDALTGEPFRYEDEPRDPTWLRWAKFASIITFLAIFFGLVWFGWEFFTAYGQARTNLSAATKNTQDDMFQIACRHSLIAAAVGGGLGLLYVAKCIIKRVDP